MVKALRKQLGVGSSGERQDSVGDRELIQQQVDRIVVKPQAAEIHLKCKTEQQADENSQDDERDSEASGRPSLSLVVPWSAAAYAAVKGIFHSPSPTPSVSPESRDMLLTAIAKARAWIDDLVEGRVASFAEIAKQEGKVERHVRFLAPLAFVSPRIISEIVQGVVSPNFTVTSLAKRLKFSWNEREDNRSVS